MDSCGANFAARLRYRRGPGVILALGISSTLALAQSAGLQFDVVSVKISPPMDPQAFMVRPGSPDPGGRWAARNATVLMLVQGAYPDYRRPGMIVGGASWVNERRFDIDAKAAATPSRDDYLHMVRALLADRFKLRVHVEPRPVDVYSLVLAREDQRLGPRLRPVTSHCLAELDAERERLSRITGPITFSSTDAQPSKGSTNINPQTGLMRLAGARTLASLAVALEAFMDKRVVDRTDLQGIHEYDVEFDFAATRTTNLAALDDTAGGSVFTAVQEQLGLKLERRREMTDVLVIDSVEMPSGN